MKDDDYNNFRNLESDSPNEDNKIISNERVVIELSSRNWCMERMRPGEGVKEGIHLLQSELSGNNYSWIPAKVPGDVYTDLFMAGEIDDPFFDRNMGKCKWVQHYEWWYNYSFNVPVEYKGKMSTLYFGGVDYSCDIYLNGIYLGHHEGMLSSFSFEVSDKLIYKNSHTPDNILAVKLDPPPKNQKNFAGMKHNFAGDYLPGLIPFGIWKGVKLILTDQARILDYRLETKILDIPKDGFAKTNVTISGNIEGFSNNVILRLTKNNEVYELNSDVINNKFNTNFYIDKASLWYPYELGNPNRYNLEIILRDGNKKIDSICEKVGLREVTRELNPGFTSEEVEKKWTFLINGKKMFLRSACWGGQPSFFYGRNNREKYKYFLNNARDCNINNLRIFGWHPPEDDDFYDICDELGITVWTNFPFATQVFSSDEIYLNKVYKECAEIVKDRRNHPSTIMWMGGEEVYFSEAHVESNNKNLMVKIGEIVKEYTNTPYEEASPLSSREGIKLGYKSKESVHANSHYYAAGAVFMEDYYPKLDACIVPELTAASSPNISSLKKFLKKEDLWPSGFGWGYHAANMDLLATLNYEVFGTAYTDSLEHFSEATQIAQGTIFQYSLEYFRRQKPHVSGVALCHFITNWPIIKWDIIDYYGTKKKSFDFVKRSYNPILPSLEYGKRRYIPGEKFSAKMFVVNDYYKEYRDVKYCVNIYNIYENSDLLNNDPSYYKLDALSTLTSNISNSVFEKEITVNIEKNSSECFSKFDWIVTGNIGEVFLIMVKLIDCDGNILSHNEYSILIDSQEVAVKKAFEMYKKGRKLREQYGKNYYRYNLNRLKEYEL